MTDAVVFPIGYVSITTGLSTHVLRAWERRYGAVSPTRTASRRRLYSQEDIERLTLLKKAVDMGHSISQIAGLGDTALAGLTAPQMTTLAVLPPDTESIPRNTSEIPQLIDACLHATQKFDDAGLHHILNQASLAQSRHTIIESIIVPFMEKVGSRWSQGRMRIAHEHLASAAVATYLNSLFYPHHGASSAYRRILIATPTGQFCYLGALAVAVAAQARGWHPVFLGPNLPSEEIAAACLRINPKIIALSITCRIDERVVERELGHLARLLDKRYPLLVGGRSSDTFRDTIEQARGAVCRSINQLAERLKP